MIAAEWLGQSSDDPLRGPFEIFHGHRGRRPARGEDGGLPGNSAGFSLENQRFFSNVAGKSSIYIQFGRNWKQLNDWSSITGMVAKNSVQNSSPRSDDKWDQSTRFQVSKPAVGGGYLIWRIWRFDRGCCRPSLIISWFPRSCQTYNWDSIITLHTQWHFTSTYTVLESTHKNKRMNMTIYSHFRELEQPESHIYIYYIYI